MPALCLKFSYYASSYAGIIAACLNQPQSIECTLGILSCSMQCAMYVYVYVHVHTYVHTYTSAIDGGIKCTFDSCNMGTSDLPDMYAQSPRAAGPRAEGIHIRQITSAHVTTIM